MWKLYTGFSWKFSVCCFTVHVFFSLSLIPHQLQFPVAEKSNCHCFVSTSVFRWEKKNCAFSSCRVIWLSHSYKDFQRDVFFHFFFLDHRLKSECNFSLGWHLSIHCGFKAHVGVSNTSFWLQQCWSKALRRAKSGKWITHELQLSQAVNSSTDRATNFMSFFGRKSQTVLNASLSTFYTVAEVHLCIFATI